MMRIKLISRTSESEQDSNNYFKGFIDGKPVFSTVEEAKIMSTNSDDIDGLSFNLNKLRKEFQVEDKRYSVETI